MSRRTAAKRPPKPDPIAAAIAQLTAELVAQGRIIAGLRDELHAAVTPRPVDLVTVAAAARLAGRSCETIRRWCAGHQIGELSDRGAFEVSLSRLKAYLLAQHGVLPAGLREKI